MSKRPVPRRSSKAGFTLVELLVVLAIISLLVAILLPALTVAKRQANTTKCLAHLREIGRALYMYAQDHKGVFPVTRQDLPDPSTGKAATTNAWWNDRLQPYLTKAVVNVGFSSNTQVKEQQFQDSRRSVFWGCPTWEGRPTTSAPILGLSRYDTGYGMQAQPSMMPNYPAAGANAPQTEWNFRGPYLGKYYQQSYWGRMASERIIVADSRLWWLHVSGGAVSGKDIIPQPLSYAAQTAFDFDRYRHGVTPPPSGVNYALKGGKVAYNALYVDGHVSTLTTAIDGYRGIRMKFP